MALNTVPPVTLPPCIIFSFTGFQIFEPAGALNAVPYFHVAGSNGPWLTAPAGATARAPLSLPAGAASGNVGARGGVVGVGVGACRARAPGLARLPPPRRGPAPAARAPCGGVLGRDHEHRAGDDGGHHSGEDK